MKETKNSHLNMDGEHFILALGTIDGIDNSILFDNLSIAYGRSSVKHTPVHLFGFKLFYRETPLDPNDINTYHCKGDTYPKAFRTYKNVDENNMNSVYEIILSKNNPDAAGNYLHDNIVFKDDNVLLSGKISLAKNKFSDDHTHQESPQQVLIKMDDVNNMKVFINKRDFVVILNNPLFYEKFSELLFDKELYMAYTTNGVTFMNRYSAQTMIDSRIL